MDDAIISVEKISKRFIISHESPERYTSFRDVLSNRFKSLFSGSNAKGGKSIETEEFWALKDLNFEINRGDRVGIIGRNGAGKSTLLKILSRITEPTSGRVTIDGRVASLLEVGTGFHPELTGRENVFLNGAILGMSRAEIRRKFDEIIAFAEVEKFLDTPVKRYSSGMYVRLAFAVAAHLDPEILIVDEVLAVGDAEFQKKCLGKMKDVSSQGRTVIFVSHNMLAIKSLCTSGILLDKGKLKMSGNIEDTVHAYLSSAKSRLSSYVDIAVEVHGIKVNSLEVSNNGVMGNFNIEEDLLFAIDIFASKEYETINTNIFFKGADDGVIFATCSTPEHLGIGHYIMSCVIPANTLNDNLYNIDLMVVVNSGTVLHFLKDIVSIEGIEGKRGGAWLGKFPGQIRPLYFKWDKKKVNELV